MARGRRKSNSKKVNNASDTAITSVNIGKINPVVEPVPDDVKLEIESTKENENLPAEEIPQVEEDKIDVNTVEPPPTDTKSEPEHSEDIKANETEPSEVEEIKPADLESTEDVKIITTEAESIPMYPNNVSSIISKLRRQAAYKHLPKSTLVKIASSKLRSRYFFNNLRSGSVTPNFNIK